MSDVVLIPTDRIKVGPRLRKPREARVAALVASIEQDGLTTPLEVSPAGKGEDAYHLTAGQLRLEALKRLGLDAPCRVKPAGAAERRRREIDENLLADGLTVLEKARYLAAAKALYDAENPGATRGGDRGNQHTGGKSRQVANLAVCQPGAVIKLEVVPAAFSVTAAERYGFAVRSVERLCRIGAKLDQAAGDILADTDWADHQFSLEQLARLEAGVQRQVAEQLTRADDPAETVQQAIDRVDERLNRNQLDFFARFETSAWPKYWNGLPAHKRVTFLRHLAAHDLPAGVRIVFDSDKAANDAA